MRLVVRSSTRRPTTNHFSQLFFSKQRRASPRERFLSGRSGAAGSTLPRRREITQGIMAAGGTTSACPNRRKRDGRYRGRERCRSGNHERAELPTVAFSLLVEERELKEETEGRRSRRGGWLATEGGWIRWLATDEECIEQGQVVDCVTSFSSRD